MRNLFLVLVLTNLGFAAWHNWFAEEPREVRYSGPETANILLPSELAVSPEELRPAPQIPDELLDGEVEVEPDLESVATSELVAEAPLADEPVSEQADVPAPEQADAPTTEAATSVAQACVSVGPFRELSQAATAAANLRTDGLDPVQRAVEGDIWVGYWVYIAAIPTIDEAEAILAKLKDSGIADSYVIPGSDTGNLISLGVFSEIARAGSRLSEVRELGYEATISDRTRRATVYWVDVLLDEGRALDFESLQPPGRIMRLEQRPCDQTVD